MIALLFENFYKLGDIRDMISLVHDSGVVNLIVTTQVGCNQCGAKMLKC